MNSDFARALLDILPERLTKGAAEDYLRDRSLTFSSTSWEDLRQRRLWPLLESGTLEEEDLITLWRFGEQSLSFHCFLYLCPAQTVKGLLDKQAVAQRLAKLQQGNLFQHPLPAYKPPSPQLADVRWETRYRGDALVVKVEESRRYRRYGELRVRNGELVRTVTEETVPAANFLEVYEDGLVVLWLQSHPYWYSGRREPGKKRSASDYSRERTRFLRVVGGFLDGCKIQPLWLVKAKSNLWKKRSGLSRPLRFSRLRLRDTQQTLLEVAAGGATDDLAKASGASKAIDAFFAAGGSCEEINLWWYDVPVTLPFTEKNEFSIGRGWTQKSYERILEGILSCN